MKAEKFAKRIIENYINVNGNISSSVFPIIKALCFYTHKKTRFIYEKKKNRIDIMGTFYDFNIVKNVYESLGIDFELEDVGSVLYYDFHITDNTYRRIKPFLESIRSHFKEVYGYSVSFDKRDGEVISMTNYEVNSKKLALSLKIIASGKLS